MQWRLQKVRVECGMFVEKGHRKKPEMSREWCNRLQMAKI
jgi:hypothetical protein